MARLGPQTRVSYGPAVFGLFLLVSVVYPQVPQNSDLTSKGVQVGQVFVTPLAVGAVSPSPLWGLTKRPKQGYHFVLVNLRIVNTTLNPNCTEWNSKIVTDARHKYGNQIPGAPGPPEIENLPFQVPSQGSYAFQIRDGETPVDLSLERLYKIERNCWKSEGFSPVEQFVPTVNISLEGLPQPTSPLEPIQPCPPQQQTPSPRHKPSYTFIDDFSYPAIHNEPDPQRKIELIEHHIAHAPCSALNPFLYYDALQTYYQLGDFPSTIKYADKLLALGDKIDAASQNQVRIIRADAQGKMK